MQQELFLKTSFTQGVVLRSLEREKKNILQFRRSTTIRDASASTILSLYTVLVNTDHKILFYLKYQIALIINVLCVCVYARVVRLNSCPARVRTKLEACLILNAGSSRRSVNIHSPLKKYMRKSWPEPQLVR